MYMIMIKNGIILTRGWGEWVYMCMYSRTRVEEVKSSGGENIKVCDRAVCICNVYI